jgi:cytochrome c biogenesis protein CcmG/thiol:disulfide interchange protein DsbE
MPARPRPRPRWLWPAVAGVVVVALAVTGLVLGQDDEAGTRGRAGGGVAPAIELPALSGEGTVSLASFRGQPVVVNLFASWCVPCRKELPAFKSVSEELGDKVTFLAVNHQDNRRAGQEMLDEFGVSYAAGYDPDGKVAIEYALIGMPSTLFVGADGTLLETHTGELDREQLEQAISRLFGITV